jgi:2-haloacid dehalogenase
MKYNLIIFDADETLFDFKKSERAALESTMRDFNLSYKESFHLEIYKEINSAVWKELEQGLITQSELNILRFQRLLERMEAPCDSRQFADTYKKHLSEASFLYESSMPLIHELSKNYRLVILSNGLADVQDNRLRKSAIAGYFGSSKFVVVRPERTPFLLLHECHQKTLHSP